MHRIAVWVLLVTAVGCSSAKFDPVQARVRLMAQTEQMRSAVLQPDHELMADLTHPALIKGLGGRAKYVQKLNEVAAEVKGQGFQFTDVILAEPTAIMEGKKAVYATVPYSIAMSGPGGAAGDKSSYFIAVSTDRGNNWTFLDGEGIAGDRAKLLQIIPDFPDEIALPAKQSATWK
jgi:hypothetical protein